MGNIKVAHYIIQQGLPNIMTLPAGAKVLTESTLTQMVEQFLVWYASILFSIVEYQKDPSLDTQHKISSLAHKTWRLAQRKKKAKADERYEIGKKLHKDETSRKRSFREMSTAEQQILEDFRSSKIWKEWNDAQWTQAKFECKVLFLKEY